MRARANAARRRRSGGARLGAAFALGLWAASVSAAAPSPPAAAPQALSDCHVAGIRNSVLCGSIERPLDPVGPSYGTRVALEYQRQFPATVRRSVIDGVAPPDMALPASFSLDNQAAFDALLAACATEPVCSREHSDLRARFTALLQSL